ncbi:MAG: hypothetical protein DMF35_09105 [Verrucomicrobia bacterium]|nr:MAG: hypothetical protein DMF35_09105 [Verrucomicrobiota bacterium]
MEHRSIEAKADALNKTGGVFAQPCFVSPKFLYRQDERLCFLSILFAVVLHNPCSYQLCDFDSRGRQSHRSKSCATFRR